MVATRGAFAVQLQGIGSANLEGSNLGHIEVQLFDCISTTDSGVIEHSSVERGMI
jgi:hypothetical protein